MRSAFDTLLGIGVGLGPATYRDDPIRLSSHKGEVLRRVNMWATGLKGMSLYSRNER
jgi:hypothetical protein